MVTEREHVGAAADLWMAWAFGLGSACFLVGPLPGFAAVVGARVDALTFFVGSILFTVGGAVQTWVAAPRGDERRLMPSTRRNGVRSNERRGGGAGRAAWRAASVQSLGTLFFNVTTFRGLQVTLENPAYDKLVWRPDAFGSICFLVSGLIAYSASARRGWRPLRIGTGWWQPAVNLLGCVFFGVAAVAGYVVGSSTSVVDQAAANVTTAAGAACFLSCAIGTGRSAWRARPDHAGPRGAVDRPRSEGQEERGL